MYYDCILSVIMIPHERLLSSSLSWVTSSLANRLGSFGKVIKILDGDVSTVVVVFEFSFPCSLFLSGGTENT